MITATKRARERAREARWMATATKRARAREARGMATATRVIRSSTVSLTTFILC